jgi:hypothetical protein
VGGPPGESRRAWQATHRAAVERSLEWAHESAARGDYADALRWVAMVESLGDELSEDLATERLAWGDALTVSRRQNR